MKCDGLNGFYRGFPISFVSIFVYRGLYFGFYDYFKQFATGNILMQFAVAQMTTLAAATAIYPLSTIKSRYEH